MKLFENINREYTPGIDLDVLDKTYNTLEAGHQKAIEASSALKAEIAKLPMNEAEDGFKQQLVNEIQNTIEANTIYGNSYGALDDLVLASGNIMSDPRVIGRLRSQKAYSDYQTQLDKSSLPQHYKNYYKKVNSYYHNDKIDEHGKIVGGSDWRPIKEYVDYIDVNTVMEKAIKSIAARKGSYSTPTVNPDGSVTTNSKSWNILTKDDIKKAIYNAFESTPGMTASLRQDYEIALDDLDSGNNPIVKDNAGNILTYNKYVDRIVDDFAETRDYNEVHSTSSYSPSKSGKSSSSNNGSEDLDILSALANKNAELNSHIQGTTDILVNPVVDGEKRKKASSESFATIINDAFNRNKKGLHMKSNNISDFVAYVRRKNPDVDIKGPVTAVNTFFNSINPNTGKQYKDDYSKEEQQILISLARSWGSQNYLDSQINRDYTEKELDARKFANSIVNGEYNRNNSSYDKALIDATNLIFFGVNGVEDKDFNIHYPGSNYAPYESIKAEHFNQDPINDLNIMMPPEIFNTLSSYYNHDIDNIFSTKRLNDGNYEISINVKNKNYLPELAYNITKANDNTTTWWNPRNWISAAASGRKDTRFKVYSDENKHKNRNLKAVFNYLSNVYENGINSADKAIKKMNNAGTDRITVSSTSYRTKTAAYNDILVQQGILGSTEANRLDDRALDNVKSALKSGAVSLGLIMEANENNVYKKSANGLKVDEFLTKSDIPNESISWGEMRISDDKDGIPDTKEGYYINIPVTENNATDEYKAGSIVKLFISGSIDEPVPAGVINSSEKLANDIVFASTKLKYPMMLMDPNPIFANTQIKYNKNGIYDIEFAGNTYNETKSMTRGFAQAIYEIQRCKDIWDGTTNTAKVIINKLNSPSINIDGNIYSILDVLSGITNISDVTIDKLITNYIVHGNAE